MPNNKQIEIECQHNDCYWYKGADCITWANNCGCESVTITNDLCHQFITKKQWNVPQTFNTRPCFNNDYPNHPFCTAERENQCYAGMGYLICKYKTKSKGVNE